MVLASWQLGQAWQWYAQRQMVEVQELCCRQQEQNSVCDLWAEKIVCRCSQASQGPVSEKRSGRQAGKHRSSTPGGSGTQACSGSCQPVDLQTNELDFKTGKAKLAKLEAALRAMPEDDEDFANERNAITAKIAETKAGMARNKPIGARIDAARRRLTRAQQRAKEAATALEMAQRVVEDSDVEIACIECELHDLEAALAHAPAVPAEICTDNTVDAVSAQLQRLLNILRGPGSGPQPCVSCNGSLCSAHRGVSTCLRGSGTTARSSSRPAEEVTWEAIPESAPTSASYVSQNEGSQTTSWRSRSRRMRRDFGLTNEKCCSGSTDSIYTMTVATANVRTLHPKEETESRSRFGGTLMVGKVELLEIAMRDAGIDVIGLQESRSRQAGNF